MTVYRINLLQLGDDPVTRAKRLSGTPQEVAQQVQASLDQDPYIDYADLIIMLCRSAPPGGFTTHDIRLAQSIIGEVGSSVSLDRVLRLEDAQYGWLRAKLEAFRWRFPHDRILRFIDDLEGAGSDGVTDVEVIDEA